MSWLKKKKDTDDTAVATDVDSPPETQPAPEALLVTGSGMEPLAPISLAPIDAVAQATLPYPGHRPECVRQTAQNAVCNCGVS